MKKTPNSPTNWAHELNTSYREQALINLEKAKQIEKLKQKETEDDDEIYGEQKSDS